MRALTRLARLNPIINVCRPRQSPWSRTMMSAPSRGGDEPYTGPKLIGPVREGDRGRMTVVLDMDETLLHSKFESVDYRQAENRRGATGSTKHSFEVMLPEEGTHPAEVVKVFTRPGLERFLAKVSEHYEPILFTAALPIYANPVLDHIDSPGRLRHRLFRDSCVLHRGYPFVKDIRMLGRDMARTVIVDNNPSAMLATMSNAIPIRDFYDDENDSELDKLVKLLAHLATLDDVRPYLEKQFQLEQRVVAKL